MNPTLRNRWEKVLKQRLDELTIAVDNYPDTEAIIIDYFEIEIADGDLAESLLEKPTETMAEGIASLNELIPPDKKDEGAHLNLQVINLPETARYEINELRSEQYGKLVSLEGIVRKSTKNCFAVKTAYFKCERCTTIQSIDETGLVFKEPMQCPKVAPILGCGRSANTTKFTFLPQRSVFTDSQKIELMENPEGMKGIQPQKITVMLNSEMVGTVQPGSKIRVNGIIEAMGRVKLDSPIVVRLDGTNAEEGRAILAPHLSDALMMEETMLSAAAKAVELAQA